MTIYYQDGTVRLFHGDCLEILDWLEADALITDPPYGMGLSSRRGGSFGESRIAGDEDTASRDAAMGLWGDRPALVFGRWSEPRPVGTRMVLTWEKGEHVGMGDLSLPWKPRLQPPASDGKRSASNLRRSTAKSPPDACPKASSTSGRSRHDRPLPNLPIQRLPRLSIPRRGGLSASQVRPSHVRPTRPGV